MNTSFAAGSEGEVLLVEDLPALAGVYAEYLRRGGLGCTLAATGAAALERIRAAVPRLVILDLQLPDMNGFDVLRIVQEEQIPASVVVITAHATIDVAVEAMRLGALDFIVKPFNAERLLVTVRNALERQRLRHLVDTYRDEFATGQFHGLIGSSLPMQAVYRTIQAAAASRAPVFITGESGTGRQLCAEALHRAGPRRDGPFVAVDLAAILPPMVEATLFGREPGPGVADADGAIAQAAGGTLYLVDPQRMESNLQARLLRYLQTGSYTRAGGVELRRADVHIVCSADLDPEREVAEGRYREDLYYHLRVIPVHLPALRERDDDVVEIARHLVVRYAREEGKAFQRLAAAAEDRLRAHSWPGNVHELQNVLRGVVVLNDGEEVTAEMLPAGIGGGIVAAIPIRVAGIVTPALAEGASPTVSGEPLKRLWEIEKEAIERAIAACAGNIPRAAAALGVAPSTLYRKKQAWDSEAS